MSVSANILPASRLHNQEQKQRLRVACGTIHLAPHCTCCLLNDAAILFQTAAAEVFGANVDVRLISRQTNITP